MNALAMALAAFWLGALVAIDLIETPTKFRVLDRNQAVKLGRAVFRNMSRMELLLGALFCIAAWRSGYLFSMGVAAALLLDALLTAFPLRRILDRSLYGLDLVDRDPNRAAEYQALRRRHVWFVAADGCKVLLLIAYVAMRIIRG